MSEKITAKQIRAFYHGYTIALNNMLDMLREAVAETEILKLDWDGGYQESPSFTHMAESFFWASTGLDPEDLELWSMAYRLAVSNVGTAWSGGYAADRSGNPDAPEPDFSYYLAAETDRHADRQGLFEDLLSDVAAMLHNIEYQKGQPRMPQAPEGDDANP